MKRLLLAVLALMSMAPTTSFAQSAPRSALDGFQFDGVLSDAILKDQHLTRRAWLNENPLGARQYWSAWDCKGKPCDSKWQANIRDKAALIQRTDKDPKPAADSTSAGR